ncbi:MAG: hypothetical protein EAZ92_07680 [Candidatus Kapaibacterium sp.]|nr:MAG: hypothetical protein EAZ92_07680 [Candidatus Kapabacteria bacterium]
MQKKNNSYVNILSQARGKLVTKRGAASLQVKKPEHEILPCFQGNIRQSVKIKKHVCTPDKILRRSTSKRMYFA